MLRCQSRPTQTPGTCSIEKLATIKVPSTSSLNSPHLHVSFVPLVRRHDGILCFTSYFFFVVSDQLEVALRQLLINPFQKFLHFLGMRFFTFRQSLSFTCFSLTSALLITLEFFISVLYLFLSGTIFCSICISSKLFLALSLPKLLHYLEFFFLSF